MTEIEPKYFSDFKLLIIKRFDTIDRRFELIDKKFEKIDRRFEDIDNKLAIIDARLDSHAEQIAEVATNIITIKHLLHRKADTSDTESLDRRVTYLEKTTGI